VEAIFVWLIGIVIVLAGAATVLQRNPIHAALSMLVALGGTAVLMAGLKAHFLATMQVLLYGGAIMVLFVFVIMLLTLKEEELGPEPSLSERLPAVIASLLIVFVLFWALAQRSKQAPVTYEKPHLDQLVDAAETRIEAQRAKAVAEADRLGQTAKAADLPTLRRRTVVHYGSTEHFARFLYTDYAVPFELITVLVMAAAAGVIVLARRPDRHTLEGTRLSSTPAGSSGGAA